MLNKKALTRVTLGKRLDFWMEMMKKNIQMKEGMAVEEMVMMMTMRQRLQWSSPVVVPDLAVAKIERCFSLGAPKSCAEVYCFLDSLLAI